jgi:hypothetical protein
VSTQTVVVEVDVVAFTLELLLLLIVPKRSVVVLVVVVPKLMRRDRSVYIVATSGSHESAR